MTNNDTELGRDEILNTSRDLVPNEFPDFDPTVPRKLLKVDDNSELLEDLALRVYMRVLEDETISTKDSLRAAKDVATMIGKAGGTQKVTYVRAENAQINQLNENPELLSHLRKAAGGLASLSGATEAEIIVSRGGQGA